MSAGQMVLPVLLVLGSGMKEGAWDPLRDQSRTPTLQLCKHINTHTLLVLFYPLLIGIHCFCVLLCVGWWGCHVCASTMLLETHNYNLLALIFLSSKWCLFSVLFHSYFHVQNYRAVYLIYEIQCTYKLFLGIRRGKTHGKSGSHISAFV